mgnify:FL=1
MTITPQRLDEIEAGIHVCDRGGPLSEVCSALREAWREAAKFARTLFYGTSVKHFTDECERRAAEEGR